MLISNLIKIYFQLKISFKQIITFEIIHTHTSGLSYLGCNSYPVRFKNGVYTEFLGPIAYPLHPGRKVIPRGCRHLKFCISCRIECT